MVICGLFLLFTSISFGVYYKRTLKSNIDYHILSAEMFGIPSALKEKGLKPLYRGPGQTGWDGQFYYYMANDLLSTKDTPQFIDNPPYRYQRIGMSLFAATVARLSGRDWVSPGTFLASYLALVLMGTWAGAQLFRKLGLHPALILFWSLSVGTQITLFNALPDAAADSFLLLALYALFSQRLVLSILPFTLAALSREIYILFPAILTLAYFFEDLKGIQSKDRILSRLLKFCVAWKHYYILILPCICTLGWHGYIALHFPPTQRLKATDLLGTPFLVWWKHISAGYLNQHPLVGSGFGALAEANCLLFYMLVLLIVLLSVIRGCRSHMRTMSPIVLGIALTAIILVGFYVSFAPLIIAHYSGYLKVLSVFFIIIPILCHFFHQPRYLHYVVIPCFIIGGAYATYYNLRVRILPDFTSDDKVTNMDKVLDKGRQECFQTWQSQVTIKGISFVREPLPWMLLDIDGKIIVDVEVKNTSPYTFRSTRDFGSVHLSYQWETAGGDTLDVSNRTAFSRPLGPGETVDLKVVSHVPDLEKSQNAVMKVSLVQEGCAWFYKVNPQSQGQITIAALQRSI